MKRKVFGLVVALITIIIALVSISINASAAVSSGICGENLTWVLDDEGTLTISGMGTMKSYWSGNAPWYDMRNSIKKVVIESGVTNIGNHAFYNCTNLTDITISDSITSIGSSAFNYCRGLVEITIPSSVASIDENAFYSCSKLHNVYYNGDLASWCEISFGGSYSNPMHYGKNLYIDGVLLEGEIIIPDNVTSIV